MGNNDFFVVSVAVCEGLKEYKHIKISGYEVHKTPVQDVDVQD